VERVRVGTHNARFQYRIVVPGHGIRHLASILTAVEGDRSEPRRIFGVVRDVTEQRLAERNVAAHVAVIESLVHWESLHQGAEPLLRSLAEAMEFDIGALWLPRGEALVCRYFWHLASIEAPEFEAATRMLRYRPGSGLPGRVWEAREPINLSNVQEDPHHERREAAALAGIHTALAMPALHDDEVVAVLEFHSFKDTEVTEPLMRSLVIIGHELGQFLAQRRGELGPPALTPRELEILSLAALGNSGPEIAERLFISTATVRTHMRNIYSKLEVSDRASAVAHALRDGLIE
jgi:DNA-binding NarL/FixJ family response regulator